MVVNPLPFCAAPSDSPVSGSRLMWCASVGLTCRNPILSQMMHGRLLTRPICSISSLDGLDFTVPADLDPPPYDYSGCGAEMLTLSTACIAAIPIIIVRFHAISTMARAVIEASRAVANVTSDTRWETGFIVDWHKGCTIPVDFHFVSRKAGD